MSRRVVEALSRVVDRRSGRRGFLSRSALGATALAVAPAAYALRPTTAHAAICDCQGMSCGCDDGCCDGYTDFCCQITGENLCPPGTVVAGWWKADGSGFCDIGTKRKPRYYLDCNLDCDEGCGCGAGGICASSCTSADCRCLDGCHSRAVDCTRFRYGQCNGEIGCVGPIACRVVTCVPPWKWDPSCSAATLTDNVTRSHDRPCLHEGFTDVAPNAFYTEAVEWMVDEGITTGFSSDIFGPDEFAPRSHVATFLWRYAGRPAPSGPAPFVDVSSDDWFSDAVAWMAEAGVTKGTAPLVFSPDRVVTRAEAVTFLWRFAGSPTPASPHGFGDVPAGSFFERAVSWAFGLGITTGVDERRFGGELWVDRAEVATFLHRYHLTTPGPEVVVE